MHVVAMHVTRIHPSDCDPPHRVTDEWKRDLLIAKLRESGWDGPALLGYPLDGRMQLISGSHRHAAALRLDTYLPVLVTPYEEVQRIYGTDEWLALMSSAPHVRTILVRD